MRKSVLLLAAALFVAPVFAAPAKKAVAKEVVKPVLELTVVEAVDSVSGKHDPQVAAMLSQFFDADVKVDTMSYEAAQQDEAIKGLDYSFLPLYIAKKTPELRAKVEPQLNAGYVLETEDLLVFPHMTNRGVLQDKPAKPGVLEIFVMSQCPYGAMAEGFVINAQKEGKLPADKEIKLRYIVNYNPNTNEFQSLHGSGEWEENVRQLLIAKYYPSKFWKYLEIRNKDYRSSRWDKAMEEAGINVNKIMKKFDTEGMELLKAEAAYTQEYGINASPSFLWGGREVLDFGSVSEIEGFEFLNPAANRPGQAAAPAGSC